MKDTAHVLRVESLTPAIEESDQSHASSFPQFGQHDLMFKTRASEIPPKFLRGAYKSAMRVALHECEVGEAVQSEAVKSRVWKLFVLLPGKFLFKLPWRSGRKEQNGG